jgi:flagellar FliL protein
VPAPSPAAVATAAAAAAAAASAAPTPAKSKAKKAKGSRKLLWIVVAIIVLAGGGGGWWWWQHKQEAAHAASKVPVAKARAQAQYYALEPAFVVNLTDEESVRYLQADLQLMTRDGDTLAAFELHAPAIRNRLLLLFGQQSAAQLAQRSGKERLQEAALTEVRKLLKAEGAPDKVEAVIFTSLVTQ